MKKRLIEFGISISALLMLAACQKEKMESTSAGLYIRPSVMSVAETKAQVENIDGRQIASIPIFENPGDTLFLTIYEKDMSDGLSGLMETKGTEITNASLSSFYVKAYAEGDWTDNTTGQNHTAGEYFAKTAVTKGTSEWSMATQYNWLNDVPLSFWSWNEVEPAVTPANGCDKATFSYAVADAVTSQKDLIFAYNGENRTFDEAGTITSRTSTNSNYTRTDNEVDIRFYHALSAIRFDISGVEDNQSVDKITIGGVASGGDCTITIQDDGTPKFEWDNLGTAKSYSQTFESTDFDSTTGRQIAGSNKEFFMIPQALTDDATLTVTFDGTDSSPKGIKAGGVEWEAGKYYTYKLTKSAYTWDYTFSCDWGYYVFSDNKNSEKSKNNTIKSYKTRSDDSSIKEAVKWKIKSYKIGDDPEVDIDNISYAYDPGWTKARASFGSTGEDDIIQISAKKADMLAKGKHDYWVNTDSREDDLDWSPEDWTDKGCIDLSKMDAYEDDSDASIGAHAMTSSNCYIVRHAGTYKLPLVYGNAIKGGNEVKNTYCTEGMSSKGTDRLERFLNHRDEKIYSGFIENNTGCIANTCEILWQSDAPVVSDLKLLGSTPSTTGGFTTKTVRYLQFTVDESTIEQSNALIAIKDEDGKIMWSWHIWITNNPDLLSDPIEVTNYSGKKYQFLTINNIGSVSSSEYLPRPDMTITLQQEGSNETVSVTVRQKLFESKTSSLMYEWGRKDPFLKKDTDYAGNTILSYVQDPNSTVVDGILNPMIWYGFANTPHYEWATPLYANLWTGIKCEYTKGAFIDRDDEMIKTIYDPSPVGYMIPPSGAFSGFDTFGVQHSGGKDASSWNVVDSKYDNGYVFYTSLGPNHTVNTSGPTISFQADGIRAGDGAKYMADRGWYHTSCLDNSSSSCAAIFMIDSDSVLAYNTAAASNGYTVRPIKE